MNSTGLSKIRTLHVVEAQVKLRKLSLKHLVAQRDRSWLEMCHCYELLDHKDAVV
jgi:hypothetical protein